MKQFKIIHENPRQTEDILNRLAVEHTVEVLKMCPSGTNILIGGIIVTLVTIEPRKTSKKVVGRVKKKVVKR